MNKAALKSQIRDNVRSQRMQLSNKQIENAAATLTKHATVDGNPELLNIIASANTIALYRAVRGELSCDGIAKYLLDQGKTICYPRVKGETMDFFEVKDLDSDFSIGAYDVPEPKMECRKIYPNDIDLILVPAVAYTQDGSRLGQGGGYYDRYLNHYGADKRPIAVGICYDFQVYSALPVEEHDYTVDYILCVPSEEA
ncbi:MAG: 5-formyltetrahydrofolate cyclo-ligase [Clostridia bacterium]|nr:5-formyltetrahydrofolate cyclo-ligase [Clostridia bacterium]